MDMIMQYGCQEALESLSCWTPELPLFKVHSSYITIIQSAL